MDHSTRVVCWREALRSWNHCDCGRVHLWYFWMVVWSGWDCWIYNL